MRSSVGKKFGAVILLAVLHVLTSSASALFDLQHVSQRAGALAESAEVQQTTSRLWSEVLQMHLDLQLHLNNPTAHPLAATTQPRLSVIERELGTLRQMMAARHHDDEARMLSSMPEVLKTHIGIIDSLTQQGRQEEARLHLETGFLPVQNRYDEQLRSINEHLEAEVQQAGVQVLAARSSALRRLAAISLGALLLVVLVMGLLWRDMVPPLRRLHAGALAIAAGNLQARSQVLQRSDELGALARAFDSMAERLEASHAELARKVEERTAELQAERLQLQQTLSELQTSTAEREQLLVTLEQLQNPVIPIADEVLVAPIVGQLNQARLEQLQASLLERVTALRARVVLLDITGVPVLDEQAAHQLLQTSRALRLLGASAVLAGIRPEVAQSLIGAGVDLQELAIAADLQRGVAMALGLLRRQIVPLISDHYGVPHSVN